MFLVYLLVTKKRNTELLIMPLVTLTATAGMMITALVPAHSVQVYLGAILVTGKVIRIFNITTNEWRLSKKM